MSIKGAALMAVYSSGGGGNSTTGNMTTTAGARAGSSLHGNVNILLGGAMLSGVILVVFLICYCCHRNMRKSASRNSQYWQEEPEEPLQVFTLDGHCYEVAGVFLATDSLASCNTLTCPQTPSPPPAYEAVVSGLQEEHKKKQSSDVADKAPLEDSSGLPSYEAALRLEAQGYV